jgi:hypothetical protein
MGSKLVGSGDGVACAGGASDRGSRLLIGGMLGGGSGPVRCGTSGESIAIFIQRTGV